MQRKRKPITMPASFRKYFRKYRLDEMIKNLYLTLPDAPTLAAHFRPKRLRLRAEITTLDIKLHQVRFSQGGDIRQKFDIGPVLEQQARLLRRLLDEQEKLLKEDARKIMEHERERIKKSIVRKSLNRLK